MPSSSSVKEKVDKVKARMLVVSSNLGSQMIQQMVGDDYQTIRHRRRLLRFSL